MYAQLGNIIFEGLVGFNAWARDIEAIYAKHELINSKPQEERTGTELQQLSLGIKFHVGFCRPEDEIKKLIDACENSEVLPLIFGNGRVIGVFLIKKITETIAQTDGLGNITFADYQISLSEYYNPDATKLERAFAKAKATALSSNNPNIIRGLPQNYLGNGAKVSTGVADAASEAKEVDRLVSQANSIPDLISRNSAKITAGLDRLGHYLGDVTAILNGDSVLSVLAPALPGSVNTVIAAALNLKAAMPIMDINNVISLNNTLSAATGQMKLDSAPINAATIIRRI